MIFYIIKDRKLVIVIIIITLALFLFSYILLQEALMFSIAFSDLPLPLYCMYEKLSMLLNQVNYSWSGSELYAKAIINLVIMDFVLAFCIFCITGGNKIYTLTIVVLYTVADVILLLSNKI